MQRGFRDNKGQEVFIPIGLWKDPHHSYCFRAFNLYREIKAHHYQVTSPVIPFLSDSEWTKLIAMAKK